MSDNLGGVSAVAALVLAVGVMIFLVSIGSGWGLSAAMAVVGILVAFLGWIFL